MNLNTLNHFRHDVYDCFERGADALFNTVDALVTEPLAQSFAELSLAPAFERGWSSLYAAFADGRIDHMHLGQVMARYAPLPAPGQRLLLGIDASTIERPESPTARDRTVVYVPNLPECGKPISFGWQFSTLVILPEQPSSWTYVLDQQRISSDTKAITVAAEQVQRILAHVSVRPILMADRWYLCHDFLVETEHVACDKLLRVKCNRVLYRAAPLPTGKRGAPRKDGERLQCNDPSTHGHCDEQWQGTDEQGHEIEVRCWNDLHLRTARHLSLSLFQVVRHGASGHERDPKVSWFAWTGQAHPPLQDIPFLYKRRYGQEHGYRFEKQALLWDQPRLRTPEQFERWSDVVAIAHNHLVLARHVVPALVRPWENRYRAASPQQVRRAMARIVGQLGTPAHPPKRRGKAAGRSKGTPVRPAARYDVVRKPKPMPKKRSQPA